MILIGLLALRSEWSHGQAAGNAALEAVRRLKGMDFEANPALKAALMRVVDSTRGTPQFVELVKDFKIDGQEAGLIEVATKFPSDPAAGDAIRWVLGTTGPERLRDALTAGPAENRESLLQAVANSGDPKAVGLLSDALKLPGISVSGKATAIRGLARTETGSAEVLRLAETGGLEEASRTTASLALARSRWPDIREKAGRILPLPRSADGGELPAVEELIRMRGDAASGAKVFQSEQAACSRCHKVGDTGLDFGPALTQIGTKLGRQALYESILDPSAGISFGYEGWSVETSDGEEVFGLLASETEEEVAIKQQTGTVVRVRKPTITKRTRQALSIMPAGLATALGRQELVDLVEYLTTLRVPPGEASGKTAGP